MRHVRRPGIPGCILALLMSVGLFLPEAGHILAHRHEAEHYSATHHGASHTASHRDDRGHASLAGHHGDGDHPHLELVAAPSVRPVSSHFAVIVHAITLARHDLAAARPIPPALTTGLSPGSREHGTPPPSRAPPQV